MESVAASVIRVTPFDTEELVRLRVAQYKHWVTSEVVFLNSPFADPVKFIHVADYIAQLEQEERERDDPLPTIVRVWERLRERSPLFSKRSFVIIWYLIFGPEAEYSRNSLTRDEPFLEEIRSLYIETERNEGPFLALNVLQGYAENYEESMSQQAKLEITQLAQEASITSQLQRLTPLETSRMNYDRVNTILSVTSDRDPEGLYDDIVCDQELPMAIYNGNTMDVEGNVIARRELYKMYRGVEFEATPPFQLEWLKSVPGAITLRLFTGSDLANAKPRDYTSATYDWEKEQIQISVPFQRGFDRDRAVATLISHLPVTPGEPRDTDIEGTVKIRNFTFRDSLFAEMVMNDPIFRQYLYIRETSLFIMKNRRPTYHMGTPGSEDHLEFRIENHESKINEPFMRQDGRDLLMEERTPYAALVITANSNRSIEAFMRIIPYLLARYQEQEEDLLAEYRQLIPGYGTLSFSESSPSAPIETTIKVLTNIAPEIFADNYARSCQSTHQPIIINPEEETEWTAKTFIYKGEQINRQTMHFPTKGEAPTHIYACPDPNIPFVGLVANTRGNRKLIPYLPCCFGDDETNTPGSFYGVYFRDEAPARNDRTRPGGVIDTNKFAEPGQFGTLPRNINFLLSLRSPGATWYRAGTVLSPSSAIHSLASIPGFGEDYPVYGDPDAREKYVANVLRPLIVDSIYPALLKQELPDISLEQIDARLRDPAVFFDPQYFFRALEEAYRINIVVFTITTDERLGGLAVPFARGVAYRPYLNPERPTVILYKHSGVEANIADFPQCELIVRHDARTGQNSYFADAALVDLLNDALAASTRARTWVFDPSQGNLIVDDEANVVLDLPTILDVTRMRGQNIDRNGKLRFVLYEDMTIATPFLPPLNTATVGPGIIETVTPERVFEFVKDLRVRGFDALVYAMNTNAAGEVSGIWWYLGAPTPKTLFFIPTTPAPLLPEYEAVHINYLPYPAIFASGDATRNQYDRLARVKYVLLEILQYLFIFNLQLPNPVPVDQFLDEITIVREGHIYNPENIDRYLPQSESFDVALAELAERIPSFFQAGKVVLDSLLLQERLRSYLRVFYDKIEGRVPELPVVMHNFYQAAADFTQRTGQVIFDNYTRASDWIHRLQQDVLTLVVTRIVTPEHLALLDPYVLLTDNGYFLVQNVLDGNYERALHVAQQWRQQGINLGFNAPALGNGRSAVYQVNEDGTLAPPSGSGSDFLLGYVKTREPATPTYYAAMLHLSR